MHDNTCFLQRLDSDSAEVVARLHSAQVFVGSPVRAQDFQWLADAAVKLIIICGSGEIPPGGTIGDVTYVQWNMKNLEACSSPRRCTKTLATYPAPAIIFLSQA